MMKKYVFFFSFFLLTLFSSAFLGGCYKETAPKVSIVTTIFPIYDWLREIIGKDNQNVKLTFLLDSGFDLHNYQPSASDIIKIVQSDLFVYIGGASDAWVEPVLKQKSKNGRRVVNLIESLSDAVVEEAEIEGAEHQHEDDVNDDSDCHCGEGEEEWDEHLWLSLRLAQRCVDLLAQEIAKLDSANAETYLRNAAAYKQKLAALDERYSSMVAAAPLKALLVADRFPFRYLVDDYGLSYFAAFSGCSTEADASFATISFLAKKLNELNLPAVLVLEGSKHKVAEAVLRVAQKKVAILEIDSLQNKTERDAEVGTSYYNVMEKNLEILKQALGEK